MEEREEKGGNGMRKGRAYSYGEGHKGKEGGEEREGEGREKYGREGRGLLIR